MIAFGLYILKVSVCLTVFYALYYVLLRGTTFFQLNRSYLLTGLIVSFLIPSIHISFSAEVYDQIASQILLQSLEQSLDGDTFPSSADVPAMNTGHTGLLALLYLLGIVFMSARFTISILKMRRVIRQSEITKKDRLLFVKTRFPYAFSFFKFIFLPGHEISPVIISHEAAHVKQYHWVDLAIVEATCIVLWFNPIVFFYKRAIKLQHEYLADAAALATGVTLPHYLNCMLDQLQVENELAPVSHFYSTSIKQRITMITKNKTPMISYVRYVLLLPFISMLIFGFSTRQPVLLPVAENNVFKTIDNTPDIYPVTNGKAVLISSTYGMRVHPVTGKNTFHTGIDFKAPIGDPVVSTADGTVVSATSGSLRGNFLVIKHGEVYSTTYSHLENLIVKVGTKVKRGEKIGLVGDTGLSNEPHLHYEILKDGKNVDPVLYLPK